MTNGVGAHYTITMIRINIGALIVRIGGFGTYFTIIRIRNPHNSIGSS